MIRNNSVGFSHQELIRNNFVSALCLDFHKINNVAPFYLDFHNIYCLDFDFCVIYPHCILIFDALISLFLAISAIYFTTQDS